MVDAEIGEALGERFGEATAEGGELGVFRIGDGGRKDGKGSGGDGGGCGCGGRSGRGRCLAVVKKVCHRGDDDCSSEDGEREDSAAVAPRR